MRSHGVHTCHPREQCSWRSLCDILIVRQPFDLWITPVDGGAFRAISDWREHEDGFVRLIVQVQGERDSDRPFPVNALFLRGARPE